MSHKQNSTLATQEGKTTWGGTVNKAQGQEPLHVWARGEGKEWKENNRRHVETGFFLRFFSLEPETKVRIIIHL